MQQSARPLVIERIGQFEARGILTSPRWKGAGASESAPAQFCNKLKSMPGCQRSMADGDGREKKAEFSGFCETDGRVAVAEGPGGRSGAWGRTRTGTGCPEGFSYQLQLSLLQPPPAAFVVWTLPLPSRDTGWIARIRQGPSSLYTFPGRTFRGLARYCSHPDVLLFHRL